MGRELGRRFKREGTYIYLRLIHVNVWQKQIQYYKAIILKLKINKLEKKMRPPEAHPSIQEMFTECQDCTRYFSKRLRASIM